MVVTGFASNVFGFEMVRDGKAKCVIVVPDQACDSIKDAANELQYHVREATGVTLNIISESSIPEESKNRFYLGKCSASDKAGIVTENLSRNGFVIKTVGNDLFLAGRDVSSPWWHYETGTLNGVYNFLDWELGVRWLWPGKLGEVIPHKDIIDIKVYDKTVTPPVQSSRIHPMYAGENGWTNLEDHKKFIEDENLWLRRQGFSWDVNLRSQHSFGDYWNRFGKSHPEYFNMLPDGTRRPDPYHVCKGAPSYVGMCQSSPGLCQQIIEDWKAARIERPDISIWVGENDTNGSCCCPECLNSDVPDKQLKIRWDKRLDYAKKDFAAEKGDWSKNLGRLSDRYARFYMKVYKAASLINPNVLVIGFAYANYADPPFQTKLNKNIVICFVGKLMYPWTPGKVKEFYDDWAGWRNTGCTMVLRPNFMLDGHCMPIFTARKLGDLLQFCHKNGMIGTEFDSNTGQYSTRGPDMYMMARRNQEMNKSTEEILSEYYQAFGPAETAIRKYFALWERLADSSATVEAYKKAPNAPVGVEVGGWNRFYVIANKIFTPKIMAEGWKILDEAKAAAKADPIALARVEFLRKGLKNAELTLATQRAYDSDDKIKLSKTLAALDQYRASIEGDHAANMNFLVSMENATWDRTMLKFIMNLPGQPLPDSWKFMWDPKQTGVNEHWFADTFDSSQWHDIGIDTPYEQQPVGKKWQTEHNGTDYLGTVWYRNTFNVKPAVKGKKCSVRLTFGAVDEACSVWVNGVKLLDRPFPYKGSYESWREPFVIDISKVVRFDRPNTLVVRVENHAGAGGIWRPVWLACSEFPASNAENRIRTRVDK
jgi:hypothetical protein